MKNELSFEYISLNEILSIRPENSFPQAQATSK